MGVLKFFFRKCPSHDRRFSPEHTTRQIYPRIIVCVFDEVAVKVKKLVVLSSVTGTISYCCFSLLFGSELGQNDGLLFSMWSGTVGMQSRIRHVGLNFRDSNPDAAYVSQKHTNLVVIDVLKAKRARNICSRSGAFEESQH
jgi:hypothetical protein